MLSDKGIDNLDKVTRQIKEEFTSHLNWMNSEKELHGLRQSVYFALFLGEDDIEKTAKLVEELFNHLLRAYNL
jgi:hypothetical protein